MEVHAPILLIIPFCSLGIPPLIPWNSPFTYLEIPPLCRGVNPHPLCPWLAVYWPPPPSPFPFAFPNGSPSQMHALLRWHRDIGFTQSDTDSYIQSCSLYKTWLLLVLEIYKKILKYFISSSVKKISIKATGGHHMTHIGLIRNGVFNFSRNTIIASCWMWLSRLSQLSSLKR
jgi:hypothetical protein